MSEDSEIKFGRSIPNAIAGNIGGLTNTDDIKIIMMFSDLDADEVEHYSSEYNNAEYIGDEYTMNRIKYLLLLKASQGRERERVVGEIGKNKLMEFMEEEEKKKGFRMQVKDFMSGTPRK